MQETIKYLRFLPFILLLIVLFTVYFARPQGIGTMYSLREVQVFSPVSTGVPSATSTTEAPTPISTSLNPEGTPNTPTPNAEQAKTPVIVDTPTPLTISPPIDLSGGTPVPTEQIEIIVVHRTNGTYDQYRVPPWLLKNGVDENLKQLMNLKSGDYMLGSSSRRPPTPTPIGTAASN